MNTIISPNNGQRVPVTIDLKVEPLMLMGKPVTNGRGEQVMNDRWIYINMPGYGMKAINVWRAHYCEKMYMSKVGIRESIGEKKLLTKELKVFLEHVSDKLVFQKFGKWYRVYLRAITNRTYSINKVVPYNWTVNPNMNVGGKMAHQCCLDWISAFHLGRFM